MEKIIEKILEYVELDEPITAESDLQNDCGLSSFDMVCLFQELCAFYKVEEDMSKLRKLHTVGELCAYMKA